MIALPPAQMAELYQQVCHAGPIALEGEAACVLFFAFCDGHTRAQVVTVRACTVEQAWQEGMALVEADPATVRWLRVDWVKAAERQTWRALKATLGRIKRNYFRLGIALDAEFTHAFLETELNANAMLYGGPHDEAACLNVGNFSRYAASRHGLKRVPFDDDAALWVFTTQGAFAGDDGAVYRLNGEGLDTGRPLTGPMTAERSVALIHSGSRYLATQVKDDGAFHYGWHPCFDRAIPSYNALRHASTLYAMLEAWEVTRDADHWRAIERALACLVGRLIQPASLPDGGEGAFLVDAGDEIKLGGNAVAILALVKHVELTGDGRFRPLVDGLAAGICHMQNRETGAFSHVLHYPSLEVKQAFRIIYYNGEAAFALMRLYGLTGDGRWLKAVEHAFAHFIQAEHWKAHDHWLAYCVNELTQHRPEERYFAFGVANVRGHLDFVERRITTYPTLLELMMAAHHTLKRMEGDPALEPSLGKLDLPRFHAALHHRANYLVNGYFAPELAMFFAAPAKIVGSFFIRHQAFRVRIDDVEHYLSGLVAYRKLLLSEQRGAR